MRLILATASFALLAACGGAATNNSAGNAAGNTAAPASTTAAPTAPANPALDARRADQIRECASDAPGHVPDGTDVNALCGCAVDKLAQGVARRDAMQQCAAQMGVQLAPPR